MTSVVEDIAARLLAGRHVLVVGERGSGRTTAVRQAVGLLQRQQARGSGLRLVQRPRFPVDTADREQPLTAQQLLVVEEVQWADDETLAVLAAHDGPALATGLRGSILEGADVVTLLPLTPEHVVGEGVDPALVRRAGGNWRLVVSLRAGEEPSGPAARTLRALWEDLDADERRSALLCGVAGRDVGPHTLRIGALGELAIARATEDELRLAHDQVVDLVHDPGERARHLLRAGRGDEARKAALDAVAADASDPARTADLLAIAAPLEGHLQDLRAEALWRSWQLEVLLAEYVEPTTARQQAAVLKARTALGDDHVGLELTGASARAALAQGILAPAGGERGDVDQQLATAASALVQGHPLPNVQAGDEEQRWVAHGLRVVDAWLRREQPPAADLDGRWQVLDGQLRLALAIERDGASALHAERLAELLLQVPTGWGCAALSRCHSDLGNAQDAAAALDAAPECNAWDRQVLAIARAEAELLTGRPRKALKALAGASFWPLLAPAAGLISHQAHLAVGEVGNADLPGAWGLEARADATAAQEWRGFSVRRERWARLAAADLPRLHALETEAREAGWMPLLARVREQLRRRGIAVARGSSSATGAQGLTPRETEVLLLVRDGLTSAQIATRIGVAQSTVETQVASAMRKLGARTRRHAVAMLEVAS